jgi:hypothetical protein
MSVSGFDERHNLKPNYVTNGHRVQHDANMLLFQRQYEEPTGLRDADVIIDVVRATEMCEDAWQRRAPLASNTAPCHTIVDDQPVYTIHEEGKYEYNRAFIVDDNGVEHAWHEQQPASRVNRRHYGDEFFVTEKSSEFVRYDSDV